MRAYPIVAFVALLLGFGCATSTTQENVDRRLAGQPQEYREGFAAGCDSGYFAAGRTSYRFRKDVGRFTADQLYGGGWNDGFQVCKSQYESYMRGLYR